MKSAIVKYNLFLFLTMAKKKAKAAKKGKKMKKK
jgi:hypothetical protein